jgi:folate-dependent phosphoribosylglycinamide formyltransferase PurN
MKIVFMTGNHPRHLFMARALARTGRLQALIMETREAHVPVAPAGLPTATAALFTKHFADREAIEARFFGVTGAADPLQGIETHAIMREELNGLKVWALLDGLQPDLLLSYGVHKLAPETLARAPRYKWNIHGGLSPWYRGVITHFWPSYFLQPQLTGMTLHETNEAIDGGDVVHQSVAPLVRGDGVHDLACRAVTSLAGELPEIVTRVAAGKVHTPAHPKTSGRIWREVDWRPAHLHPIYDLYANRIVDRYLDGEFGSSEPKLIRQF